MSPRADKESLSPEERGRLREESEEVLAENALLKSHLEIQRKELEMARSQLSAHSYENERALQLAKQLHEDKAKQEAELSSLRQHQFESDLENFGLKLLEGHDLPVAKRSQKKLRMMCLECGAELLLTPYKVFYRSQKRRPCPYCADREAERQTLMQKTFQVGVSAKHAEELDAVFKYWQGRRSSKFSFLGFDAERSAFESLSAFSEFIVEAAVTSLSLDAKNQKRIDELALFIYHELGTNPDTLTSEDKAVASKQFLDSWGENEHGLFFDLIWPLALQRAKQGPEEPEIDPELLLRKKQLQDLLGNVGSNKAT